MLPCVMGAGDRVPTNLPIDGHSFRRVEVLTETPRRRHWTVVLVPGALAVEWPSLGVDLREVEMAVKALGCTYRRLRPPPWLRVPPFAIWRRKVRDSGRRYDREYRPADRWAPGPAPSRFLPSYCWHSAPILRSGSPRAASCRSLPR